MVLSRKSWTDPAQFQHHLEGTSAGFWVFADRRHQYVPVQTLRDLEKTFGEEQAHVVLAHRNLGVQALARTESTPQRASFLSVLLLA